MSSDVRDLMSVVGCTLEFQEGYSVFVGIDHRPKIMSGSSNKPTSISIVGVVSSRRGLRKLGFDRDAWMGIDALVDYTISDSVYQDDVLSLSILLNNIVIPIDSQVDDMVQLSLSGFLTGITTLAPPHASSLSAYTGTGYGLSISLSTTQDGQSAVFPATLVTNEVTNVPMNVHSEVTDFGPLHEHYGEHHRMLSLVGVSTILDLPRLLDWYSYSKVSNADRTCPVSLIHRGPGTSAEAIDVIITGMRLSLSGSSDKVDVSIDAIADEPLTPSILWR